MIWMAASDIHGSAQYCERLMECFYEEGADRLLLLGDLLSHGYLPDVSDSGRTVEDMLNELAPHIVSVMGNCDRFEDQAYLDFEMRRDLWTMYFHGRAVHMTHGHMYGPGHPPKHENGDILLCGHTHVPACRNYGDFLYLNPGSVARPRDGSWHGYLLITEEEILWKDLDGEIQMRFAWR